MNRIEQVLAYVKQEESRHNTTAYRDTELYGSSIGHKREAAAYRKIRYFIEQLMINNS